MSRKDVESSESSVVSRQYQRQATFSARGRYSLTVSFISLCRLAALETPERKTYVHFTIQKTARSKTKRSHEGNILQVCRHRHVPGILGRLLSVRSR